MPRQARIVIPYTAHHITQRGNYRQNIFDKDTDYKQYCEWINEYAQEKGLDILLTGSVRPKDIFGREDFILVFLMMPIFTGR